MIRVCFVLLLVAFVAAQDTDYKLIGSNMILQRDSDKVRLWGQTTGSTSAMLTIFSSGKQVDLYTTAVTHNMWEIKLKPYAAGGPYDFVVKTGAEIKYTNVYFGDVFLCSGQSNMEFVVVQSVNGSQEVEDSKNYPQLHLFHVQNNEQEKPVDNVNGQWLPSSPSSSPGFSAVCYFYGREIYKLHQGQVPIGLIESNWGGTNILAWMSPDARKVCNNTASINDQNTPSHLWNGMIVPLLKYAIKGAIWYQGEANAGEPDRYACYFPAMITDWRAKFGVGDFSFYFVQLAGWAPGGDHFAAIRLTQLSALRLPNTGFATAIDVGDPQDIHPIYKQIVGQRLFYNAANMIYGRDFAFRGPTYNHSSVSHFGKHADVAVVFSDAVGGIVPIGTPKCTKCCTGNQGTFEVVTSKRPKFFAPNNVTITAADTIVLGVDLVDAFENILAIRYAYYGYPECIFHSNHGTYTLPMGPFAVSF